MAISDQLRAQKSADALWANDSASQALGIVLERVAPGQATLSLAIEQRHTNGHDICHGGFIFTLADTAFAFACNSYNQVTVAQHNSITFITPGKLGDTLTATAIEVDRSGRSGIYDATVVNQDNTTIAVFRGHSRTIKGQLFEE